MKTNLERLHDVALKHNHDRGEGKTFYDCHLVAGAIELGNKEIIIWLPTLKRRKHVKDMLREVLNDHNINILRQPNRSCWILKNRSRIIFTTESFDGYSNESAIVQFS